MEGEPTRVFLDASVLIAAAGSASGAAAWRLDVCRGKRYAAIYSRQAPTEAIKNVREKLPEAALVQLFREVASLGGEVIDVSSEDADAVASLIATTDRHAFAAARKGRAAFLRTLEKRNLLQNPAPENSTSLSFQIMSPGDFLHLLRETHT